MDETRAQLLTEIENFMRAHRIAESTFGKRAVNDGKFVSRLRGGANMTFATVARVQRFLEAMKEAA